MKKVRNSTMISWLSADAISTDVDQKNVLAWNRGSSIWTLVTPAGAADLSSLCRASAACWTFYTVPGSAPGTFLKDADSFRAAAGN